MVAPGKFNWVSNPAIMATVTMLIMLMAIPCNVHGMRNLDTTLHFLEIRAVDS
jgi:hypothetical protein